MDVFSAIGWVEGLSNSALVVRIALVALGIALFGVGSALYIGAGLGAGPRDSMMLAVSRRTRWRIGVVRGAIEVTVLVLGILFGGTAGIGTLALALLVGPSVEAAFWLVRRLGLATRRAMVVEELGPLDAA